MILAEKLEEAEDGQHDGNFRRQFVLGLTDDARRDGQQAQMSRLLVALLFQRKKILCGFKNKGEIG